MKQAKASSNKVEQRTKERKAKLEELVGAYADSEAFWDTFYNRFCTRTGLTKQWHLAQIKDFAHLLDSREQKLFIYFGLGATAEETAKALKIKQGELTEQWWHLIDAYGGNLTDILHHDHD